MAQKCSNAISNGKPLMEQMLVHTSSQDAQELVSLSCSSWFSKPHKTSKSFPVEKEGEHRDGRSTGPFCIMRLILISVFRKEEKRSESWKGVAAGESW
jgi:hypothetical protein